MRLAVALAALALATCDASRPASRPAEQPGPAPTTEPAPEAPVVAKEADACPAIDEAKIAPPTCDDAIIKTPIPDIAGTPHALDKFYEAYARLARGRATDHVRIAMYGDSNLTYDQFTGHMRRVLQGRFGDAGHGFVSSAIPWHWYEHWDVHHNGKYDKWKHIATSTHQIADRHYGFANMAVESTAPGATVWVATADEGAPVGTKASRFDVFFLKTARGGEFDVVADGTLVRTVSARAEKTELGFERVELPDGPHKVECITKTAAPVRLFGVALERTEKPSFVIDSLGAGALNFEQLSLVKNETRLPGYAKRNWNLVIYWLGTNTFLVDKHQGWVNKVLAGLREALPDVSILLMSPADTMLKWEDTRSDPRIIHVGKQLEEFAGIEKVGFWDFRKAMGGPTSIKTFVKHRLAAGDLIHLRKEGSELMANRFMCALAADFRRYLAEHPRAGCEP